MNPSLRVTCTALVHICPHGQNPFLGEVQVKREEKVVYRARRGGEGRGGEGRGGGDLPAFLIVPPPFFSLAFLQCHPLSLDSPRALHSVGIVNGQYVQLTNSFSLFSGPFSIISLNQLTGVY